MRESENSLVEIEFPGTGKADMGNKDIEERCLKRTKIGHLGLARQHVLAEEDKTFCVSWVQKFW